MSNKVLTLENHEHETFGKFAALIINPNQRGSLCSYECVGCGANNTTEIPSFGMVYKFIYCDACGRKLILLSLKTGYGPYSTDEILVSNTMLLWWLNLAQPEENFIDPRDLKEFDALTRQYQDSAKVYYELVQKIAKERNTALVSLFPEGSTKLKLW